MKSRGGGKFDNTFLVMPRQFRSKQSVKQIWMRAESNSYARLFLLWKVWRL